MLASHNYWHWALYFIEKVGIGPVARSLSHVDASWPGHVTSVPLPLLPTQGQHEAALEVFDSQVGSHAGATGLCL